MRAWLANILGIARPAMVKPDAKAAVRRALQKAQRDRTPITLESPQDLVLATTVRKVLHDEIIVAQPCMNGMVYPLADGDALKLSFIEQNTNITGQTYCLGRVKAAGPDGAVHVYRLRLPLELGFDDRRNQPRNPIDPSVAPEVRITGSRLRGLLAGALADISITGARIHASVPGGSIQIGHELQVQFLLPEPAGVIDEVVEVQRLETDGATGLDAVCVSFRRRLPRLEALLRMTTERVPMPLEQAQRKVA